MELARILRDLNLVEESEKCNGASACSLIRVLSQIHHRFVAEESAKLGLLKSTVQLLRSGEGCWLFPECSSDLSAAYVELVGCFTGYAALPVCDTDSGTLPSSSYEQIPPKAEAVGSALLALTVQLGEAVRSSDSTISGTARSLIRTLGPTLCVFSITHLQDQAWTSKASRKCALELLNSTVRATSSGSLLELLCGKVEGDKRGMLGPILDTLQPELTKENWKRNQAVKHVFSWVLVQVGRPWLADYLEKVFPPSLLISDDYRTDNKVLGVHCLHHIVLNVPAADLRQFNRAQVLYHALFNHLYTSEAPLIQVVLPCLVDLLSVLEKPHVHTGSPRKPNHFDDVLRLILTHMEMEHKLALRRIYASNLLLFIEKMGIGIARHLKRLERVVVGYLEVCDAPEEKARLSILEVLERTIQTAWPRIECRMGVLAKSLLRFLVDISSESLSPELREELMTRASRCLLLLDHCSQGKLLVLLKEVDSSCVSDSVLECIRSLTTAQGV
ncbi:TELO2-interacting protein 2 [Salminus brasiliensis]|uniref:TELO2-interacting protein 2 n=1 Tax=Salminus brasiliensis TaxID=930266 RepID=UPI003B839670